MQEKNHTTLANAIKRLPVHEVPPEVWDQIEQEMDMQQAIQQLPSHTPPAAIWDSIEAELQSTPTVRQLRPRRRGYWAAAAGIALLITASVFIWKNQSDGDRIVYEASIVQGTFAYEENWDEDDKILNLAVEEFRKDPLAKADSDYERLLTEWEELNEAKAEVKAMMAKYGEDGQLIKQMGSIERSRSEVVKAMAVHI
jgi:hypothetical protein